MPAVGMILLMLLLTSCQDKEDVDTKEDFIYFKTMDDDDLIKEDYKLPKTQTKTGVKTILQDMKNPKKDETKSVFPETVTVNQVVIYDNGVEIDCNAAYNKMNVVTKTLFHAAVVQTLTQLEGVEEVKFTVEGQEIREKDGSIQRPFKASDFVQNVGSSIHSTKKTTLTLYYGNESGNKLIKEEVSVRYNSNSTIERLVMDQLLKGSEKKDELTTLPSETGILNVTVKDKNCYVNLSDGFATGALKVNPEVAIYSIVNSILDNSDAQKVQLSIGGETNVMFQGVLDLSKPLSKDLSIVEDK